jgi:teichuronic acid exporter
VSKKAAAEAGLWSALDIVLRQGILFVVSVILARLLTPEDFGVVALLTFFTSLSVVFVQGGLSAALIQRQRTSLEEESAVFWWNLGASCVLGGALIAAGPMIASFYGFAVLRPLTILAALQIIVSALGAVQMALLTRALRFDLLTKAGILSSAAAGLIGVTAAFAGAGVWTLALQLLALAFFNSAAMWLISDWRPIAHFRLATIRHLIAFGSWVGIGSVLDVIYTQGFSLVIGKLHSVRELGLYNRASGIQLLPSSALSTIISRIALPLFSSRAGDKAALRRGLRLAIAIAMLLNLPIMIGIALLSDLIITVLFGPRWLPAAPILTILAFSGVLFPIHVINLQLVLAQGRSRSFINNELAKKTIGIVCIIVGSIFGISGLAYSQVVYNILAFLVNAQPARHSLHYGPLRQAADLAGIGGATAMMGVAVWAVRQVLSTSPLVTLFSCTVTGAVVYLATGILGRSAGFREALDLLLETPLGRRALKGWLV